MTIKAWITAILVSLGVVGGYVAHMINSSPLPESKWGVSCAPAITILEQKKRCGFIDLGQQITVVGKVIRTKIHADGDFSVDIVPNPGYEWVLFYGGYKNRGYLHVEFMPCERTYIDVESVLKEVSRRYNEGIYTEVSVTGRWAFDGVDHRGKWEDQLHNCLETRSPDPSVGWTEIHPAYSITIL